MKGTNGTTITTKQIILWNSDDINIPDYDNINNEDKKLFYRQFF